MLAKRHETVQAESIEVTHESHRAPTFTTSLGLTVRKEATTNLPTRCSDVHISPSNLLSGRQTNDKVGQLLWAWFSLLRKSADEIVEP